ncbi:MAG: biotin/lipoyl-binding protein [Roseburia inulinivorans]
MEVSTQQVTSGQITSKVRGSGSVEASESYSVTIEETRKIATVNVKKDAEVATGDLLFTLEDTDSDELDRCKEESKRGTGEPMNLQCLPQGSQWQSARALRLERDLASPRNKMRSQHDKSESEGCAGAVDACTGKCR